MVQLVPRQLKRYREYAGLSRLELSRRSKVTPSIITWTEQGRYIPYPDQLARIAEAVGADDPDALLEPDGGELMAQTAAKALEEWQAWIDDNMQTPPQLEQMGIGLDDIVEASRQAFK